MTVRVAVTGHRASALEHADMDVLLSRVDEVLEGVLQAGPSDHWTLLSGLAEGADRLLAERALAAGYVLRALLPFPQTEYETDFRDAGSIEDFRALLRSAGSVEVVAPEDVDERMNPEDGRDGAYVRLGRRLASEAHVLIALWDGDPARGGGGTAEVVAAATARHVPVVWIDSEAPHEVRAFSSKHPPTTVPPPVQSGVCAVVAPCLQVQPSEASE